MLHVVPLTLAQANAIVAQHHRHHMPVRGHRFSIGALDLKTGRIVGAAIVGRPVARAVDPYAVAEVTRLATDGTANVCSLLYGACARAAKAMGFVRIQTYVLTSESGVSLRASGWDFDGDTRGGSWSRISRPRADLGPIDAKARYVKTLNPPSDREGTRHARRDMDDSRHLPAPGQDDGAGNRVRRVR